MAGRPDRVRITALQPGPPGQSAYELATTNGFVGTEADWLASLKGADGATPAFGEWQQIDLAPPVNLLGGGTVTWGTGGGGFLRWTQVGNTILLRVFFTFAADAVMPSPSGFGIPTASFPAEPRPAPPNSMIPGGFGFLYVAPASGKPMEAYTLPPAIFGTSLVFLTGSGQIAGGLPAALWGNSHPIALTGRLLTMQAAIDYEIDPSDPLYREA